MLSPVVVPLQILATEWNAPLIKSVNWWKARQLVSVRVSATAVTLRRRSAVQMEMSILMNVIFVSSLASLLCRTNCWPCHIKANVVSHLCLKKVQDLRYLCHVVFWATQCSEPKPMVIRVSLRYGTFPAITCFPVRGPDWSVHCAA